MGQKINPNGLRYGVYRNWNSSWYASKHEYPTLILNDHLIRKQILLKYGKQLQISQIKIIRRNEQITINLLTAKASIIMGENEKIYKRLKAFLINVIKNSRDKDSKFELILKITPIKNIYVDAKWIANDIATKIENRGNYKVLQKIAIANAMKSGAIGIKTKISGRLNGVDIARSEGYSKGKIPLNTLRSRIDYAFTISHTTYGVIGVKIWICLGENLNKKNHHFRTHTKGSV